MERVVLLIFALVQFVTAAAWSGYNVKATELMDEKRYIEAADYWQKHTQEIEDSVTSGMDAAIVLQDWLHSLSKQLNCLYMIDDYESMNKICDEYLAVAKRYIEDMDQDMLDEANAYLMKNYGALDYGLTDTYAIAYQNGEEAYLKAIELADPTDHDFISTTYLDLAQLYYKWGQKDNERDKYEKALHALKDSGIKTPLIQSQKAITKARIGTTATDDKEATRFFNEALADIEQALKAEKSADEKAEMMRKKGKILMLQADKLKIDNYSKARKCYEQYLKQKKDKVRTEYRSMTESQRRQNWLALHQFIYDCCRLGAKASDMSYDIALYSKGYLLRPENAKVSTWKDIAAKLNKDEAAIEFLAFDDKLKANIVTKGCKQPALVDICDISDVLRKNINGYSVKYLLSSSEAKVKDLIYNDEKLPTIIWNHSLMNAIGDKKKVYFSPDGFLHQLAIEYFVPDSTITAYRLSSTARLLQPRKKIDGAMLLCGGVDYQHEDNFNIAATNDREAYRYLEGKVSELSYLPGSKAEADTIYAIRANPRDSLIMGSAATESRIRSLAPNFQILHLSTHGYFASKFPVATDLKSMVDDNALSHSGVIFAGASNNLNSELFDPVNADGILSAAEIADSDWSNVDLVVLSACQTGLGYQTDDGIYGLQRGLKMGGADGLILSLWSVNDYTTYLLMKYFYEELQSNPDSAHAAFMKARERLKHEGDSQEIGFSAATLSHTNATSTRRKLYDKPIYTHPFILIDIF